ncbi:MAG: hypothetical protein QOJ29_2971 [Thermoleophilaceae bacterium]|jgi:hypothetical protein|nr:hypothetical protein [Thermoleophilaceae bacterium]
MRRIAMCATTALALACATSTALAQSTVDIDSHATPVVRKFSPNTTPTTLTVNLKFHGPNGGSADTLQRAVLKFTYGAKLNGNLFPSCTAQTIRDHQKCPKGSVIGTGSALGILGGDTDNPTKEQIKVTLYNGPKGKSIVFRIQGDAPAVIDVPFDAPLKTFSGGSYNFQLTVDVPELLQVIVGLPVSLDYFNVKVGATRVVKGKKRGYIETLICPPLALVPLQGDFTFLEADPFHIDTYIHCGA